MVADWSGTARVYEESFGMLCAGVIPMILDVLGPPAGRVLLDVGAGTGALAAAAQADGWRARAVEPEASMRALGRDLHPEVTLQDGALPDRLPEVGSVDVVTASFVLNHLEDPRAGAKALLRAVKPGGTVAATIWPSGPGMPRAQHYDLWERMFSRAGASSPASVRLPAEMDFPRSPQGLVGLLEQGGLVGVTAGLVEWDFLVPPAALWAAVESGVAGVGARYLAQSHEVREACRREFLAGSRDYLHGDVLCFRAVAVLGVGTRPALA